MIVLELKDTGEDKYLQYSSTKILGRMYDDNSEQIKVIIPTSESESVCTMLVSTQDGTPIGAINVNSNGLVNIGNSLSQYPCCKIGFSFFRSDGSTKNSEICTYTFLKALKPEGFAPIPINPPVPPFLNNYLKKENVYTGAWFSNFSDNIVTINDELEIKNTNFVGIKPQINDKCFGIIQYNAGFCYVTANINEIGDIITKITITSLVNNKIPSKVSELEKTNKKLDTLWGFNEGISYDFVTDSTMRYEKTIPKGAKIASVEMIGGYNQQVGESEWVNADVESVKVRGTNMFDEDLLLTATGWTKENGVYTGRVNYIYNPNIFSSLVFKSNTQYYISYNITQIDANNVRVIITYTDGTTDTIYNSGITNERKTVSKIQFEYGTNGTIELSNLIVAKSAVAVEYSPYILNTYPIPQAVRNLQGYGWGLYDTETQSEVCNSIERTENGWQYAYRIEVQEPVTSISNLIIRDTPDTTDITDLMADFPNNFNVEPYGTITFENSAGLNVPNTVKFTRELSDVPVTSKQIDERTTENRPIVTSMLDYAVKAAMCDRVGAAWTDEQKTGAWQRLNSIKTTIDGVLVAGANYYLGEQTAVNVTLPETAEVGQEILVSWYNGGTASTLTIDGNMLDFDYTPTANTRSEINALWDGTYWSVIGMSQEVLV